MRPTFMGFESAKRGLAVNQKGLDIIGHNLANVYTQGYTRQRLDVYSVGSNVSAGRYSSTKTDMAGQGVGMGGVSQTRDPFLDKRFRDEYADVGYYDEVNSILSDIEAAIGDPETTTKTGLKNAMANISNAIKELASNANSKVHANVVATEFKNLTLTLHQFDAKLNNILFQQKNDLQIATTNVNEVLAKIAGINKTISDDVNSRATDNEYYGPNELMDERNVLLDELAQYGNITVKTKSDGTVSIDMNGKNILDGEKHDTLRYKENTDGTVSLLWNSDGKNLDSPTGALKGVMEMINGRGPYAQGANESNAKGVLYFKDQLNMYANTLTNAFNNVIPECDADGNPKLDASGQIIYKQLLGARVVDANGNVNVLGNTPTTAANISLSDAWSNDSAYVIFDLNDNSSEYANALSNVLSSKEHTFRVNGVTTTATFEEFVNGYVTEVGSETSFNIGRYEATAAIAQQTLDQRDSVSAVAPDEETANMMLYNKSFQAMSRLMTSLDEALDILINRTGMIGR